MKKFLEIIKPIFIDEIALEIYHLEFCRHFVQGWDELIPKHNITCI